MKILVLFFLLIPPIVFAEECEVETLGYMVENGVFKQTTFLKSYHYDIFDTIKEAKKHGDPLFDSSTGKYLVFEMMPRDAFICSGYSKGKE